MINKISIIYEYIHEFALQFKEDNSNIITSEFIEDQKLKSDVKKLFYSQEQLKLSMNLLTLGGETSEEEFDHYFLAARREFETTHTIEASSSKALKKSKKSWLDENKKIEFDWDKSHIKSYRERYFKYLSKQGRSDEEIAELKKSTISILEGFGNPTAKDPFFKRGMVVGSVQSGKTANFNGVINSSIDMGYKLIIVLSGIMEDLRYQTQKRIEKDVLGPLVGQEYIGVGNICRMEHLKVEVNSITSRDTDFNHAIAKTNLPLEKYNILVVKKNVSVLKNILLWLNRYVNKSDPQIKYPVLVIDDEADNASLNNIGHKGKEEATKINKEIRAILGLFEKKTYVGYTATPFANILQYKNEEPSRPFIIKSKGEEYSFKLSGDLFPDDFIELLRPSSHYVGIKQFFDTKNGNIRKIDPLLSPPIKSTDYLYSFPPRFFKNSNPLEPTISKEKGTRASKKYDPYPQILPESLKEAVRCFILSIAIRDSRDDKMRNSKFYQPHNTMLIHISRFETWQNRTKKLLVNYVDDISNQINSGYSSPIYEIFQFTWDKHYKHIVGTIKEKYLDPKKYHDDYMEIVDFESDIKSRLSKAIDGIDIRAINSSNEGQNLVYPSIDDMDFEQKKYIAIGGNRLSRGFTLEGLTINYFLRGTNNADTLMQMGRWFGYRIGYLDCCKLFTISDNIEKFNEASLIIEDLEQKFEQLSKLPDKTPKDFTIWIRNNPDIIKLTRGNFLRNLNKMSLDFGSKIQQSSKFSIKKEKIIQSYDSFKEIVKDLKWNADIKQGYLIHYTNQEGLKKFLDFSELNSTMLNLNIIGLRGYLEECKLKQKLTNWIIAIKTPKSGGGNCFEIELNGQNYKIKQTIRRGPAEYTQASESLFYEDIFKVKNAQIISSSDFSIGLDDETKKNAESEFKIKIENELLNDPKNPMDPLTAKKKADKTSIPDFQYRKFMNESTGILMIYPLEISKIFETNDKISSVDYKNKLKKFGHDKDLIDINIPLIGFALGFPDIRGIEAGDYVTRHLVKDIEEMNIEELIEYIKEENLSIDIEEDWQRESLLKEIIDIEVSTWNDEFDNQ